MSVLYAEKNISGDNGLHDLGNINLDLRDGDYLDRGSDDADDDVSQSCDTEAGGKGIGGDSKKRATAVLFQYSNNNYDHIYNDDIDKDKDQIIPRLGSPANQNRLQFLNRPFFAPSFVKGTVPQLQKVFMADACHSHFGKYTLFLCYGMTANSNASLVAFAILFGNKTTSTWGPSEIDSKVILMGHEIVKLL